MKDLMTIEEVAAELDTSVQGVRYRMRKLGGFMPVSKVEDQIGKGRKAFLYSRQQVELLQQKTWRRGYPSGVQDPQRLAEMRTLHNSGWSFRAIGEQYGITGARVHQLLKKYEEES